MDSKPTPKRWALACTGTTLAVMILGVATTTFSANVEVRGIDMRGFSGLRVGSGLEMVVEVGPAFSVDAEGESGVIDTIDIHMEGKTLVGGTQA